MPTLHVEYAEQGNEWGILFIFSWFCEYSNLEYVHIHVIYRGSQAEYVVHILVVAPQEYVNIYLTRRMPTSPPCCVMPGRGSDGPLVLILCCVVAVEMPTPPPPRRVLTEPLHDVAMQNIVCCMAYKREVEGGSNIAQ